MKKSNENEKRKNPTWKILLVVAVLILILAFVTTCRHVMVNSNMREAANNGANNVLELNDGSSEDKDSDGKGSDDKTTGNMKDDKSTDDTTGNTKDGTDESTQEGSTKDNAKKDNGTTAGKVDSKTDAKAASTTESKNPNSSTTAIPSNTTASQTTEASTERVPEPGSGGAGTGTGGGNVQPPKTTEHVHTWVDVTEIVHHTERGHYEDVMIAPEEVMPKYEDHQVCHHCGFDYTANGEHGKCPDGTGPWGYGNRTVQVGTYTLPAVYKEQWVKDADAYDEAVVTGRRCTTCGAEEKK